MSNKILLIIYSFLIKPLSAGTDFKCQNMTSNKSP